MKKLIIFSIFLIGLFFIETSTVRAITIQCDSICPVTYPPEMLNTKIKNRQTHSRIIDTMGTTAIAVGDYIGMTGRQLGMKHRKWCSEFMHMYFGQRYRNVADNRAISWKNVGSPSSYGCIGCVAVMRHHVGIVKGYTDNGHIILYSGNHGRKVGIGTYSRNRFIAFRNV